MRTGLGREGSRRARTGRAGKAECGQCHIFVNEGKKSLSKTQRSEHERLDATIGVGSKSRLACQALMGQENVTIELLGFGSG